MPPTGAGSTCGVTVVDKFDLGSCKINTDTQSGHLHRGERLAKLAVWVLVLLPVILCGVANAGEARYEYDALGRLARVIDEQGRAAVYVYGPTGNIVQIIREDAPLGPPSVSSVFPNFVRQGQARRVRLVGTNLLGSSVTTPDSSLTISIEQASQTELVIKALPRPDTALGPKSLVVTNEAGTTNAGLDVRSALTLGTAPTPIVLPPDSLAHAVVIQLSEAEPTPIAFTISGDSGIAVISPDVVTVPAGSTEFQVAVTGIQSGRGSLRVSSSDPGMAQTIPIFVAANSAPRSPVLGVYLPPAAPTTPVLLPGSNLGVYLPVAPPTTPVLLPGSNLGVYLPAAPPTTPVLLPSWNLGVYLPLGAQGISVFIPAAPVGVMYDAP